MWSDPASIGESNGGTSAGWFQLQRTLPWILHKISGCFFMLGVVQHAAGNGNMRTRRTITTFPGLHSHSGVVIGPQQACYVPPEQYRACCGRYLALNIIELAFLSPHSWRIATQV